MKKTNNEKQAQTMIGTDSINMNRKSDKDLTNIDNEEMNYDETSILVSEDLDGNEFPLDQNQLACVRYAINNTCMLCIAGAGSGKTEVLTHRVVNMVDECNVAGRNIICLTFSKKAAIEMRNRLRLRSRASQNAHSFDMVHISTIHSFCYNAVQLNLESLPDHVQEATLITTSKEKEQIIIEVLDQDYHFDSNNPKLLRDKVKEVLNYIQRLPYSEMLHIMNYDKLNTFTITDDNDRIYREMRQRMKVKGLMDFNDLIHICIHMLEHDQNFTSSCLSIHRHILVDEFQDMGILEFELLKKLISISDKSVDRSISCFGDDDQCIYSFKGTSPKIFDWFRRLYPNCKVYTINTNYRSSNSIVQVANTLIQGNTERVSKQIRACGYVPDDSVLIQPVFDRNNEGLFIAERIQHLVNNNALKIKYSDIAILCRVNRHLAETKPYLKDHNIPFKEIESNDKKLKPGKESKLVLDLLAHFVILMYAGEDNYALGERSISRSDDAFRRLVPKHKQRRIDLKYLEAIQKDEGSGISLWDALRYAVENRFPCVRSELPDKKTEGSKAQLTMHNFAMNQPTHASFKHRPTTKMINLPTQKVLVDFYTNFQTILKKAESIAPRILPQDFVCKIIDFICKETPYREEFLSKKADLESIGELKRRAHVVLFSVSQRDAWQSWLHKLLKSQENSGSIVFSSNNGDRDSVSISSIHQAKGLEWKVVFLIGMNTGVLPIHENSSEVVEDERRIAFVGMTRAKQSLFITVWDKDESMTVRARSRFVDEILNSNLNVKLNSRRTNDELLDSIQNHRNIELPSTQFVRPTPSKSKMDLQEQRMENELEDDDIQKDILDSDNIITVGQYMFPKKKKIETVSKKKIVRVVDETKLTKGQRKDIEKSSNMLSNWLSKCSHTKSTVENQNMKSVEEARAVKQTSSQFTVHEDSPNTKARSDQKINNKTMKRKRLDTHVESKENLESTSKKQRLELKKDSGSAIVLTEKISMEPKVNPEPKTKKKTLVLAINKKKKYVSDGTTSKDISTAESLSSSTTNPSSIASVESTNPSQGKTPDDIICEIYSETPVGVQFKIGQYCSSCDEFVSSTYIEEIQEQIKDMDIPCEHCNDSISPKMQVSYTLPLLDVKQNAVSSQQQVVEEDCHKFSKKAMRMIISNINSCNGNNGQIDNKWLLENQRDLFWNILYQYGHIQKYIHNVLHPKPKVTPTKKQQSLLDLFVAVKK